ncbi:MAG TPA: SRPBCC family protein [Dehalococcoidia bacterium]|jgi:uncharacterized protein YndB with AHSA1/START domain|nr:SRPBCC family protein [Dehalococcoidia bacterium]
MSKVEREIVVQAPADTVYQVWRNFENFPNFMSNIDAVTETGNGRSRWRAKGPLGSAAEWDAEILVDEPGRAIAWRSIDTPDNNVRTQGAVRFEDAGDATRLFVTMSYDAPAKGLGELAAKIFSNPEKQVDEDLHRFKQMIETQGQAGYARSTSEVIGHGTPATSMRVNESVDPEESAVQGRYTGTSGADEPPYGPGMSNDESVRGVRAHPETSTTNAPAAPRPATRPTTPRPTTTGTPGGMDGVPTERDLKRDHGETSEKSDSRLL